MYTIIGGDGREYGPVSAEQIRAWLAAGRADLETKAKAEGTLEWKPLGDFPEFSGGEAEPPPLAWEQAAAALAGRWTRLGAYLIDRAIEAAFVLPGAMLLGWATLMRLTQGEWPQDAGVGRTAEGILVLGLGLFIIFVIQTCLLTFRGQSLGMVFLGIRIVRHRDGSPPGFIHAVLLRNWLINLIVSLRYIGPAFFLADALFIFRPDRRCLHDIIADTKVVRN